MTSMSSALADVAMLRGNTQPRVVQINRKRPRAAAVGAAPQPQGTLAAWVSARRAMGVAEADAVQQWHGARL